LFRSLVVRSAAILAVLSLLLASASALWAETIARCGQGWLESIDGYLVLHVKGTPYEMGAQHGALLKDHIGDNLRYLLDVKHLTKTKLGQLPFSPKAAIGSIIKFQEPFVPQKYFEEIAGLAAGSGIDREELRVANFIPELFHCSGFAVMNSATKDGTLYHGRVLDYSVDWQLQNHALLLVAEPAGGVPFVNVTYAGFIGCVTGMNAESISVGEMGGGGLGHWQGMPMALLVREALAAHDLDGAIAVFRDHPRTCQYFYVVTDGKTNRAVGMEASWNKFDLVQPGQSHPLLPHGIKDTVLVSAGARYEELARRVNDGFGTFDAESARKLMDCPVAMQSNLHDVLFAPKSTDLWIANASRGDQPQPAAKQPYHKFNLRELLQRQPDPGAKEIPLSRGDQPQ